MKKQILLLAALSLIFVACKKDSKKEADDKFVATFEEAAISPAGPGSTFIMPNDTTVFLESGNFLVQQTVAYDGSYVTGAVISNITDTTFVTSQDANKSIAGGAYAGKNYVVWYCNAWGEPDVIKLKVASVVPGMYVCNNVYAYNSMTKGDAIAGAPFGADDWFKLTITGSLIGISGTNRVEVDLAKGTNIMTEWTYVDLSPLGEVDELHFFMDGSRTGIYGLNTPSYFCIDNLGAKK